jgi:hypothetical protein
MPNYSFLTPQISNQYGKPFVPPLKGNVIGNGEVNRNGKQLTNGKRNDSVNGKQIKQFPVINYLEYENYNEIEYNNLMKVLNTIYTNHYKCTYY